MCIHNRLPDDETSGSKHVEDKKIKNWNINWEKVIFFGLYCKIILQITVQKHKIRKFKFVNC